MSFLSQHPVISYWFPFFNSQWNHFSTANQTWAHTHTVWQTKILHTTKCLRWASPPVKPQHSPCLMHTDPEEQARGIPGRPINSWLCRCHPPPPADRQPRHSSVDQLAGSVVRIGGQSKREASRYRKFSSSLSRGWLKLVRLVSSVSDLTQWKHKTMTKILPKIIIIIITIMDTYRAPSQGSPGRLQYKFNTQMHVHTHT